jgi:phage shock protein A
VGLFSRFKRALKSNLNDMISKAENPEKMLDQLLLEMNEQLVESKKTVAATIADEKRLERAVAQNRGEAAEWERKAVLAVKAGKDDLAREALLRKQEYDNVCRQYQTQWESQRATVAKLKDSLRQLQQRIEEASHKRNLLVARVKRAEAQKRIQQTMSSMSDSSSFEAFDRMAEKVDRLEAEAEALKEIESTGPGDSVEQQFRALEASDASPDKLLEDLKARLTRLEDKTQDT